MKLLLPKYFLANESLPEEVFSGISLLTKNQQELQIIHPKQIQNEFQSVSILCHDLISSFPGQLWHFFQAFKNNPQLFAFKS